MLSSASSPTREDEAALICLCACVGAGTGVCVCVCAGVSPFSSPNLACAWMRGMCAGYVLRVAERQPACALTSACLSIPALRA